MTPAIHEAMKPASRIGINVAALLLAGIATFSLGGWAHRRWLPALPAGGAIGEASNEPQPEKPPANTLDLALSESNPLRRALALDSALVSASPGVLRALAETHLYDKDMLGLILARWTAVAPREAVDWVKEKTFSGEGLWAQAEEIFAQWAKQDAEAVKEYLRTALKPAFRFHAVAALADSLILTHPDEALALLAEFPDDWSLKENREVWINQDPAAAARLLARYPLGWAGGTDILNEAAARWAQRDPQAAAQWAMSELEHRRGFTNSALMANIVKIWGRTDRAAALEFAVTIPDAWRLNFAGADVLKEWAGAEPAAALKWLMEAPLRGEARSNALWEVAEAASRRDPQAAADYLLSLPDSQARDNALHSLGAEWAKTNPAAALAASDKLENPEARENLVSGLGRSLAESDAKAAAAFALAVPEQPIPFYRHILSGMKERGSTQEAYEWMTRLPETVAARLAGDLFFVSQMEQNAAQQITTAQNLPEGPLRDKVVASTIGQFFERQPEQAFTWVSALEPGPLRDNALRALERVQPPERTDSWRALSETRKTEMLQKLR